MTARADAVAAPIVRLHAVDSTQRYAAELAAEGAADGTAVVAETQTQGRGRRGRVWRDEPGASLLVSVIVRTSLAPARLATLSLAAGVAVAEALISTGGVDARLKWPNDVLVGGRKIAGVLLERHADAVILGIGINVAQASVPAELTAHATSIAHEGGRADRDAVLEMLLASLGRWRARLEQEGFDPVRARWTALAAMLGTRVSVDDVAGTALGLDVDGALLIEASTGVTRVLAGDVLQAGGR
jgi:BirA family biotin operon repressor/biotin-[acetyl-CoA-carboxylase] ligase